eukprot:gene36506-45019_t
MGLFVIAHKYQMPGLLNLCANYLLSILNVNTAVDTFILANVYSLTKLREMALTFIVRNYKAVHDVTPDIMERLPKELEGAVREPG